MISFLLRIAGQILLSPVNLHPELCSELEDAYAKDACLGRLMEDRLLFAVSAPEENHHREMGLQYHLILIPGAVRSAKPFCTWRLARKHGRRTHLGGLRKLLYVVRDRAFRLDTHIHLDSQITRYLWVCITSCLRRS